MKTRPSLARIVVLAVLLAGMAIGAAHLATRAPDIPPELPMPIVHRVVLTPAQQAAGVKARLAAQQDNYERLDTTMRTILGDEPTIRRACAPGSGDAVRVTFLETRPSDFGMRATHRDFTVVMQPMADGGVIAQWHRIDLAEGGYRRFDPVRRELDAEAWARAKALLRHARFARLETSIYHPVVILEVEPPAFYIESCLGGEYRAVERVAANQENDPEFLRVARGLAAMAGGVYTDEITPETGR